MIERDDRERRTRHDRSVAPATHVERVRPVEGTSSVVDATVIDMLLIRPPLGHRPRTLGARPQHVHDCR
jgi:hypothetical protein